MTSNSRKTPDQAKFPLTNSTQGSLTEHWWLSSIERQGVAAFAPTPGYQVFRNVREFGAQGDGTTDDTKAINAAIAAGNRCGSGCNSSTVTPALVYFPPGTYMVSSPIIQYYQTQLVGDAIDFPVLKATADFTGIAVIDANPRTQGKNWWLNRNNYFRQIRNFRIDVTAQPKSSGTGIHWQVAQATSLENIEFLMREDPSSENAQQGIFMEDGSGGFMSNLTFVGGKYGAFFGNQQFTVRNATFRNCHTAIYMKWNWVWTLHDITISNCHVGIDISDGGEVQNVGSVLLLDSTFSNVSLGINTAFTPTQSLTNGTLMLENVDMSADVSVAIGHLSSGRTILDGNTVIPSWVQGNTYSGGKRVTMQGRRSTASPRPKALTDKQGRLVTRSKPQYRDLDHAKFISTKSRGAKGDGRSDDTYVIQSLFDQVRPDEVVYFDHGTYLISDTIRVPKDVKVVGEVWPLIMAGGNSTFKNQADPKPLWQVGEKGDVGNVEMQDLTFTTQGSQPGAILMEFNVAGETKGSAGLFDVHFRIGGAAGTQLQSDRCLKTPFVDTVPAPDCMGAFMLVHVTPEASVYMENTWLWVADHELDLEGEEKINVYNGRGLVVESTKGSWLWGTASEHSVLSNYQVSNAKNVFMGLIQAETPYFQGNPDALVPFDRNSTFNDPDFSSSCSGSDNCARAWGLRVTNSTDVYLYGAGLYSFFDNYNQTCVGENSCQDNMISIEDSEVTLFGVSTKASKNMITLDGSPAVLDADNRNTFCAAVALFER